MTARKNYLNKVKEAMRKGQSSSGLIVTVNSRSNKKPETVEVIDRVVTFDDQPDQLWRAKDSHGYAQAIEDKAGSILSDYLSLTGKAA